MADFYSDLAQTAKDVLREFTQGTLHLVVKTETPGPSSFEPGTVTETIYTLDGIAEGVDKKFVDGTTIFASDKTLTVATTAINQTTGASETIVPTPEHIVRIDGDSRDKIIKRVDKIPAAGIPVIYMIFISG